MALNFTNNAEGSLAINISTSATSITLGSGEGARFPVLATGDWFPLYLIDTSSPEKYEITFCTARSGDTLTIERSQEGTSPLAFSAGDRAELRLTAAALDEFARSGLRDLTVLRGLNFAEASGSANNLNVAVDNISSYDNHTQINVLTVAANDQAAVTINVNGLGAVPIKQRDNQDLAAGTLPAKTVVNLTYSAAYASFIIGNPSPPAATTYGSATFATEGLVSLAYLNSQITYDVNDLTPRKAQTQFSVSRIIKDFYDNNVEETQPRWPVAWTWRGKGVGDRVITGGPESLKAGKAWQYRTLTVNSGGGHLQPSGTGTLVIRCTGKMTFAGLLTLPRSDRFFPHKFIGPKGTEQSGTPRYDPEYHLIQETAFGPQGGTATLGARCNEDQVEAAILNNLPMNYFHGGHGLGVRRSDSADATIAARGGLILIAPEIEFAATAKVYMGSYESAGNAGDSAGGMLMCVCDTLTNQGADFFAGNDGNAKSAAQWDSAANDNDAANGQMFHLDPGDYTVTRIF